ncbi:hypothetical protein BBJ28_00017440 [Nothophytophthora sp. Chile5]|nr:hypothetical protein BBJ28_00017440 [Nothophytophthora sp. Chile5]
MTNGSLQVDISLDTRLLGAILASAKYRFELQPVPLEEINARLRKKLAKQSEELARLRKQEHEQALERELKKARLDPAPSNSPPVCFRTTFASICSMRRVGWAKVPVGLFAVTDDAQIRCLHAGQYIVAMVLQFDPLKRRLAFHLLKNLEFIRRAECAQGDTSLTSILVLEEGDELTLNYTSGVPMSGHFAAIRLGD